MLDKGCAFPYPVRSILRKGATYGASWRFLPPSRERCRQERHPVRPRHVADMSTTCLHGCL